MCRLPGRVQYNRYTGLSRPAYVFWCLVYYVIKDVLLLYFYIAFRFFKFLFYDVWRMVYEKFHPDGEDDEESEDNEEAYEEEDERYPEEEDISFCQLFNVGADMCLLVDHVEMCPDETAFIRVVDDEGYTPLYKRKVRRDKAGNRFIVFNGTNHYLDDNKTQPIAIKK